MISDSDFSRLRVFRELVFGKVSRIGMQKNGGRIEFLSKRNMWRLFNQARGAYLLLTAAYTLTEEDNGKTVIFGSATGFTVTLPAVTGGGWHFPFVVGTAPTSGNHVVANAAGSSGDNIHGTIVDLAGTGDAVSASDQVNFVANQAAVGDWATFNCLDASRWFVSGMAAVAAGATASG